MAEGTLRSPIVRQILVSFVLTTLAFSFSVGWAALAQKKAAEDTTELSRGYVPLALRLGEVRATSATLATLVDGIPDERDPVSSRALLRTLLSIRETTFREVRRELDHLAASGNPASRVSAKGWLSELSEIAELVSDDAGLFDRAFAALSSGDKEAVGKQVTALSSVEHDAVRRLRAMADDVSSAMDQVTQAADARAKRATAALVVLSLATLGVGIVLALRTRRLLRPLADLRARALSVAKGDLVPRVLPEAENEIGELAEAFEKMVSALSRAQALGLSNERFAAIGKMAAHVTHEIRNPLSSIGLNLELLEEELPASSAEARELSAAIRRETERLERLSEEYLRVARLPSPNMEAEDLGATLREIVRFSKSEMDRSGVTVALHLTSEIPPLRFDEGQLRQALLNLLRNAREAMPQGGPIDITVSAEGMGVSLLVEDRGGGIPEEILGRVFDPFFSTKGEGTGLGLAIVRHIVEGHGGTVHCERREGGGTRFRITLPLAPSRESLSTIRKA